MELKHLVRVLLLALLIGGTAIAITVADQLEIPEKPGEGVTVRPAVASWTSALPVSAVFVALLEELGYNVEEPTLFPSNSLAYVAITEGDIDYWPNGWFPLHLPQVPGDFEEKATLFKPHCPSCGIQGYLVNIPAIEEFGITSLDDFRRAEVKEAFDGDGDGKADLYGCPPGWGCHERIEFHLDAYDLRGDVNHITADYSAGFADVLARVGAGEPTLYYTWGPSAYILQLVPGEDVKWINVPEIKMTDEDREAGFTEDAFIASPAGGVTETVKMGFVAADIDVVANDEFLEANPAAKMLFALVRLPLDWISEVDRKINVEDLSEEEIRVEAEQWLADHETLVNAWLEAARVHAGAFE